MNDISTGGSRLVDSRFDDAEAELDRGEPWRFRDDGSPNPLTILVTGWSTGHTRHGEAEFLNGRDRDGKAWSVLVGSVVLTKRLIHGEVSEWDDDAKEFVVTDMQGRVQPGDVVSIRFKGDVESANGKTYPDFVVARKPGEKAAEPDPAAGTATDPEDEFGF